MNAPKYIEYNGLKFCRDEKTGYYLNSTIRKRLHRYIWEHEVGPIPKGYHVHHIDGDKTNNTLDNLSIMSPRGHERLHGQETARKEMARANIEKARPYAIAWHKSEEGRRVHSEMHKGLKAPREEKRCALCGKTYLGTKTQMFCSLACKAADRRKSGVDDIQRICDVCGKAYMATRYSKTRKYCSPECASIAHRGWTQRKKTV